MTKVSTTSKLKQNANSLILSSNKITMNLIIGRPSLKGIPSSIVLVLIWLVVLSPHVRGDSLLHVKPTQQVKEEDRQPTSRNERPPKGEEDG
ncbi:hypothetical protein ACSBR2_041486 [Camellia fascicularis]